MHAYVVDDSKTMRMAVSKLLSLLGMSITEAVDGAEALQKLQAEEAKPSLIMLDWNMPEMNGYELLNALRADELYNDTRIIMLTTRNEIENIRRALAAGADEYIMKPFTDDMLIEKVKMVLPELDEAEANTE